eukprot:TRINITY_DN98675_c0_g1_i1.p1 TRINITY_DN98675_c0_g1~~TRINITY_DN98675_c0_g1_i1.p1  ORF type:complete len:428 (-),score=37.44 TRINITY_DN98675_c0_g1_i1:43-1326(-)
MNKIDKKLLANTSVLYVEDEELIRDEMHYFLCKYLKNIYVAKNGQEGLDLFNEVNPDIIITDLQMPVMNGLEMLKLIDNKNIPVIITTAFSDIEYFMQAIELRVDKFIVKPIDLGEILEGIQTLVSRSNLKQRLFENDKLLEIIDENVLISITDTEGTIIDVSDAFCEYVGYTKTELLGQNHRIIRHEDTNDSFFFEMWKTIKSGKTFKSEIKSRKKSNEECWANITITPVIKNNEIINFIAIRQDITNKKKLEKLAIHDDMTGLYNRRYLNKIIDSEIRRTKREKTSLSLLTIDIDNFKKYNDTYGHPAGDEVLVKVAKVLKDNAQRASDFCFRMGGEEFGILFSDLGIEKSITFSEEIVKAVANLKIKHEGSDTGDYLTVSAGLIVQSHEYLESFKELYKHSDDALYESKQKGKNQIHLSDKSQE